MLATDTVFWQTMVGTGKAKSALGWHKETTFHRQGSPNQLSGELANTGLLMRKLGTHLSAQDTQCHETWCIELML